jgi:hypothetical protein
MSSTAKTHKRAGADDELVGSGNLKLDDILNAGMAGAYKRPWHRLERGLRLNRLRSFVDDERTRSSLSETEVVQLLALLHKALDKKMLNSKTTVVYDHDEETIKEIKGLVSHRSSDGILRYQFVEKRATAITMRRKRGAAEAKIEEN